MSAPRSPAEGRQLGRGEAELASLFTRRGHLVRQQYAVWRQDQVGQYFIDMVLDSLAIEVVTHPHPPWGHFTQRLRAQNLVSDGWRVLYVWLRDDELTERCVDAALTFLLDVRLGTQHSYRVINAAGDVVRVGWFQQDELISGNPDEPPPKPDDTPLAMQPIRLDEER